MTEGAAVGVAPPVGLAPPAADEGEVVVLVGVGASYALPPVPLLALASPTAMGDTESNTLVVNAVRSVLRKSLPFVSAYGVS
jgi:hypothetical protein